jgi:hypothetical protein
MKRNQKSVSDLGAAAYILMHEYKVIGRRGKDIFFSIKEEAVEEFDRLNMDYLSSEFHRFDSCIMSLKKIGEYQFDSRPHRFVTDLRGGSLHLDAQVQSHWQEGQAVYFEADGESADKFDEIALEYLSSDFHRFDSCLMSLKKIGEYISEQN